MIGTSDDTRELYAASILVTNFDLTIGLMLGVFDNKSKVTQDRGQ